MPLLITLPTLLFREFQCGPQSSHAAGPGSSAHQLHRNTGPVAFMSVTLSFFASPSQL